MLKRDQYIAWINEIDKDDISLVGGKGANLGEIEKIGIPVPPAFIITSSAYYFFLEQAALRPKINHYLSSLNLADPKSLDQTSNAIRELIISSSIPKEISDIVIKNYFKLGGIFKSALVAIRSSATAEDLPGASFAGQQETFLNISGEATVVEKVRQCWASLFTPRAIFYREEQKFDHFKVGIAVVIQKMIQSETSGVMFTIDPVSQEKKLIIEATYGLGELIVQGQVIPDHYEVDKATLTVTRKEISIQDKMLVKRGSENHLVNVPVKIRGHQKVANSEIVQLAQIGKKLEKHYFFPQDIEWAIEKNKIFIVQTRPVTTIKTQQQQKEKEQLSEQRTLSKLKPILYGIGASPGIVSGPVKIIKSPKEIHRISPGDILVTEMTNPDFVPAMRKAVAIITDKGGRTAHAAIVSRELGIPCVVGTREATKVLKNEQIVTVDGTSGNVYKGGLAKSQAGKLNSEKIGPLNLLPYGLRSPRTATKVYVNLAEQERVKEVSKLSVDGVGLLRAEFMMAQIGVHPKKIIHDKKQKMFVEKLATEIAKFCEAFSPRPVVYRATDFKTSEYRNLVGGRDYEPSEENPLIGYRGACRYIADPSVFELELSAIKEVRNKRGFKNLWLMIPFVRTPLEMIKVKKIVAGLGLARSSSFKIWLMVEIPSNVILLEEFIETGIDGVSIGSNDLTMLILGVDRDNSEISSIYNEQDPAVLWALEKTIKTCHKYKITSSICGQAPSDSPDLVEKLIQWGITSISVNPDAVERTRELIYIQEKKLCSK